MMIFIYRIYSFAVYNSAPNFEQVQRDKLSIMFWKTVEIHTSEIINGLYNHGID